MLRWGHLDVAETLEELAQPAHTALLLWDYVERTVSHSFNREAFVAQSIRLAAAARQAGVAVFFAQPDETSLEDLGPGVVRMRLKHQIVKAEDGARATRSAKPIEFIKELAPGPTDVVFRKFLPNGFRGTNLAWLLRGRGIKTVVLAGIAVETGVDGTAREAINEGFYAVVVRDAVSSRSKARYDAALTIIEMLYDVCGAQDLMAIWDRSRSKSATA